MDAIKKIIKTDDAFNILDNSNCAGSDWGVGGCAILASALNKLYGYPIYVIYNKKFKGVEHFGVKTNNDSIIDNDGEHINAEEWLNFFKENEFPRSGELIVIPYTEKINMNGVKFDDDASKKLAILIKKYKKNNLLNEHDISVTFLNQLSKNVNNKLAKKFLIGWSERGEGNKVSLSNREFFILQGIRNNGSVPNMKKQIREVVRGVLLEMFPKLKHKNEHEKYEFIDWLSMKIGKKIGNKLGSGVSGAVFEIGNAVIKITTRNHLDQASILNKNINSTVKVYSNGKINVPKRFLKNEFGTASKFVQIPRGKILVKDSGSLFYLIMEKVNVSNDIENDIEDIIWALKSYIENVENKSSDIPSLRVLFQERNNKEFIKKIVNFLRDDYVQSKTDYNKYLETLSELIVVFRNVGKYFDWMDIHAGQFGRNSKGELVAFDIDNSIESTNSFVKHTINEGVSDYYTLVSYNDEDNEHLEDFGIDEYEAYDDAIEIAKSGGISILRDKKLNSLLIENKSKRIIGALWISNSSNKFSFDVAIDSSYQNMGLSSYLINDAIEEYKMQKEAYGDDFYMEVDVINPKLAKILEKKYGFHKVADISQHRALMSVENSKLFENEKNKKNVDCKKYFNFDSLNNFVEFDKPLYSIIEKRKTAKLIYINPKQYIYRIAKEFGGLSYSDVADSGAVIKKNIKKYANNMKSGDKFPIPYYSIGNNNQEGRHRALAAMENGCNKIPVIELKEVSYNEFIDTINELRDLSFDEINSLFKDRGFDNGISSLGYNSLKRYIDYNSDKLNEIFFKENIELKNISDDDEYWDRVKIIAKNKKGEEVGYAILDMVMSPDSEFVFMDDEYKYSDEEIDKHFPEDFAAKLEHIEVYKKYRKKGFGKELMDEVVKYVKKRGYKTLFLISSPIGFEPKISLDDLSKFYSGYGFKIIKDFGNANDMVLQLRENIEINNLQTIHIADIFNMIDYHDSYRDLYPGYSESENKFEDDYYYDSREKAIEDAVSVIDLFKSMPNPIPVFRTIKVLSIEEIDFDDLGESWSFERKSAIDFANNQGLGNVLLSGFVYKENVDWEDTIEHFFKYSRGYSSYDENEIKIQNSGNYVFDVTVTEIDKLKNEFFVRNTIREVLKEDVNNDEYIVSEYSSYVKLHDDDEYEITKVIADSNHDYTTVDNVRYELSGSKKEEVVDINLVENTIENIFYEEQVLRYVEYIENGGIIQSFPVQVNKVCLNLECMIENLEDDFDTQYDILIPLHKDVFDIGIDNLIYNNDEYCINDISKIRSADELHDLFDKDLYDLYYDEGDEELLKNKKIIVSKIEDALIAIIEHFKYEVEYTLTDFNHRFEALKRLGKNKIMVDEL